MLKKDITYLDLDDNQVTETFYFNLTKAELAEMEASGGKDGFADHLRAIAANRDPAEILPIFKDIIERTVGRRSEDGKRFIKSPEITDEFMQTGAYSELFVELITDVSKMVEFMKGTVPAELRDKMAESFERVTQGNKLIGEVVALPEKDIAETNWRPVKHLDQYSDAELLEMPQDEFDQIVGRDPRKMSKAHLIVAMQRRSTGN